MVDEAHDRLPLRASTSTMMFLDVVQSVSIIEHDELSGIARIRQFLDACAGELLARHAGHLVQQMGDGLLLTFDTPRDAVAYGCAAHALAAHGAEALPLRVRAGVHKSSVYTDDTAYYGLGVNIAARLAAEALPGETVVSAAVVDELKPGLDAEVEDLGECRLKHLQAPVRLYKAWPAGQPRAVQPAESPLVASTLPVIAVFPLVNRAEGPPSIVGELVADGTIAELSRVRSFRVISRQSTGWLDRPAVQAQAREHLQPDYQVGGRFLAQGEQVLLWLELREARTDEVRWAERYTTTTAELLDAPSRLLNDICGEIVARIGEDALIRAHYNPPRSLSSCELLFGAITLTARTSLAHFDRPRQLLEALIERHRTSALPRVWLAHWYVIRRVQGLAPPGQDDGAEAFYMAERALDLDPHSAHAMATQGFAATHFLKDFDLARSRLEAALAEDRSCAWAWLYLGALNAFTGRGEEAERCCAEALACSPLDPIRHFFLTISASAAFTNQNYAQAVEWALASRRHDRYHASTVRVLAMALALQGRVEEARTVGQELLRIEPTLTIERYLARTPSAGFEVGARCAEGLRLAGIPVR